MVLYELLSGCRPALGHHQLQIAKKLSKGIRPALGSPQEVQFHSLHSLMTECWDTKPEKVCTLFLAPLSPSQTMHAMCGSNKAKLTCPVCVCVCVCVCPEAPGCAVCAADAAA